MRFTSLLIVVLTLIACRSSDTGDRYLDVSLGQPLEVPPDLAKFEAAYGEISIPGGTNLANQLFRSPSSPEDPKEK